MLKGDLVNWDESEWEIENMVSTDEGVHWICEPTRPGHVILPEKRNFTSHMSMCSKFRGKVSVVEDESTMHAMDKEIARYPACGQASETMDGR